MNIVNPCKSLLLVGAVIFSMNASAEGTLPFAEGTLPFAEGTLPFAEGTLPFAEGTLPFALPKDQLPFTMSGKAFEVKGQNEESVKNTEVNVAMQIVGGKQGRVIDDKLKAKCRNGDTAVPAQGEVYVNDDRFVVEAICANLKDTSAPRQILAKNSGRILQFDGTFKVDSAAKPAGFDGELKRTDSVVVNPEGGNVSTNKVKFSLSVGAPVVPMNPEDEELLEVSDEVGGLSNLIK